MLAASAEIPDLQIQANVCLFPPFTFISSSLYLIRYFQLMIVYFKIIDNKIYILILDLLISSYVLFSNFRYPY